MQRLTYVMGAVAISATVATAANPADDLAAAVKERRHLMKEIVAPAAKLGGRMVKGTIPFEAGKAAKAMQEINGVPAKYVTLFPKGTELGAVPDSEALPAIWESFDDFKALAAKLEKASAEAAAAAEMGDATFAGAFDGMIKVCKECHQSYRKKRN